MISGLGSNYASSWATTLFSRIDRGSDGAIDQTDLQTALESAGITGSSTAQSTAQTLVAALDGDGDNQVSAADLTSALSELFGRIDELLSQGSSASAPSGPPPGAGGPPPGPPPADDAKAESGYTKDELTGIAGEISGTDDKRASLMNELAANFDAADTDGDGKVSRSEAMAYDCSRTESSTGAASSSATGSNDEVLSAMLRLILAYGASDTGSTSTTTSTVSVTA